MNLCSKNHEEVCFDGKQCPVCDVRYDMGRDVDNLKQEVKDLQAYVERLESEKE